MHNTIQELRGNIRVFVRARPPSTFGGCEGNEEGNDEKGGKGPGGARKEMDEMGEAKDPYRVVVKTHIGSGAIGSENGLTLVSTSCGGKGKEALLFVVIENFIPTNKPYSILWLLYTSPTHTRARTHVCTKNRVPAQKAKEREAQKTSMTLNSTVCSDRTRRSHRSSPKSIILFRVLWMGTTSASLPTARLEAERHLLCKGLEARIRSTGKTDMGVLIFLFLCL